MEYFIIILVFSFLKMGICNGNANYGFWEGPNGYNYTRIGLKSYLESSTGRANSEFNPEVCHTDKHFTLMQKIESYRIIADKIRKAAKEDLKGDTYYQLVEFLDKFGPRLTGSASLENSIDFLKEEITSIPIVNRVWTEDVPVPKWERGDESAILTKPVHKNLALFSLGQSLPTGENGIKAAVIVFDNYASVIGNLTNLMGKIVVCNYAGAEGDMLNTKQTGYPEISRSGAIAVLYRSPASFSLYSPHARRVNLYYDDVSPEIPIAYLTTEDTEFMSRLYKRGKLLEIELKISNKDYNALTNSRNLFGDIIGRSGENGEHIILSAHTDTWDVASGAQDDAVGVYLLLQTLRLLSNLELRPKLTIRGALWTAEEYGFNGSIVYINQHRNEVMTGLKLAMEADYACLTNGGFIFNSDYAGKMRENYGLSHEELGCMLHGINDLIGADTTIGLNYQSDQYGTDLDKFTELEVPVVSLLGDDGRYFWYHHTEADTVTALNSLQIDNCLASWATATYILADFDYPEKPSTISPTATTTTRTTDQPDNGNSGAEDSIVKLPIFSFLMIFIINFHA